MNEFVGLVNFARQMKTTSATRGALIQLEGNVAYLVNEHKSFTLKAEFPEPLGTGTFYASEAPVKTEIVERRDERVRFCWKERGKIKDIFVPDKRPIKEKAEEVFQRYWREPNVKVPITFLDDLLPDILVTRLRVKGDEIITIQKRSDGTVQLNNRVKLRIGLMEAPNYPDSGEVSVFTQDLYVLRGNIRNPLMISVKENSPVCIAGYFTFGGKFKGVIAHLVYEV